MVGWEEEAYRVRQSQLFDLYSSHRLKSLLFRSRVDLDLVQTCLVANQGLVFCRSRVLEALNHHIHLCLLSHHSGYTRVEGIGGEDSMYHRCRLSSVVLADLRGLAVDLVLEVVHDRRDLLKDQSS